jgi:DNA-binding transcriptional ArsR family regulator
MEKGENMKEACILKNLEQIKVMAHPLRMQLLEAFSHKLMTTKQVAQLLGKQPTKLYHHVDSLKRVGLIKLVKTQKKRGTVEKYYRTVAHRFTVDRKLFRLGPQTKETLGELQAMVAAMFEDTLSEVHQSIAQKLIKPENKRSPAILARSRIYTTPDQIEKLRKKIQKLLNECSTVNRKQGKVEYGLTLVFYPIKKKK